MTAGLNSPAWYRVAQTRPRLGSNVEVQRQVFRGRIWYVLHDRASGRFHRFPPALYAILARMDGEQTVQTIWLAALDQLGADAPSQTDVLRFLADLHRTDALVSDTRPNYAMQTQRRLAGARQRLKQKLGNPVALRIPLVDPHDFLSLWARRCAPWLGWAGVVLWLAVVGAGLVATAMNWPRLTHNELDRVFEPGNLLLLFLVFPLVKLFHEIGHGLLTRHFGGEVHEAGLMLLLFVPVPYIDCSAATALSSRHKRMLVGAAGILVDLFIGAIALLLWLRMEPGLARSLCFNVMLVTWASTLLFNGNPLLRYDGYYVLCDWLEMPNLAQQASRYYTYLVQRYFLAIADRENPAQDGREAAILSVYGVSALAYRLVLSLAIALTLAGYLFQLGVLLALWVLGSMLLRPVWQSLRFLLQSPLLDGRRLRALVLTAGLFLAVGYGLAGLSLSSRTRHEGVVSALDDSVVRAQADGMVQRVLARAEQPVVRDALLMELHNPQAQAQLRMASGQVAEMRARLALARQQSRHEVQQLEERLVQSLRELAHFEAQARQVRVHSPLDGVFVPERTDDLLGRYVTRGQSLGYVLHPDHVGVRMIVTQEDARRLLEAGPATQAQAVVRTVDQPGRIWRARVVRTVPAATDELPDATLSIAGGGSVGLDPGRPDARRAVEKLFLVHLAFEPDQGPLPRPGIRVSAWLEHPAQPLSMEVRDGLLRTWTRLIGH